LRRRTALLLLLALVASACQLRTDVQIEINADETGTFALELGFDEELRQLAEGDGGDLSLDGFELGEDTPVGWTVSDFDDGEFAGTRISTPFSSLDDLTSKLALLAENGDGGDPTDDLVDSVTISRDGNDFRFEAELAQLDEAFADAGGDGLEFGIDPTQFLENLFLIRFVVTMPGELTSHNADEVDGSTLVWNIALDGENRTLRAMSGSDDGFAVGTLLISIAGLLIIGLLGLTIARRRRETVAPLEPYAAAGHAFEYGEAEASVGADPFIR
jgi:hypothetical protein